MGPLGAYGLGVAFWIEEHERGVHAVPCVGDDRPEANAGGARRSGPSGLIVLLTEQRERATNKVAY
jgi:hypothetical protein